MSLAGTPASKLATGFGVGVAAFSAATFGFGTTFAVIAYRGGSNPQTVVLLRAAAFVLLIGVLLATLGRIARLPRRALVGSLWMAMTLAVVSLGYQASVAFIPVGLAALCLYTFPLMVGLIAVTARRDRMTPGKALALVAAFVGLVLALSPGFGVLDWRGIALALLAALSMSLTMSFGSEAMRDQDPILVSLYTNVWMFIGLFVVVFASGTIALPRTGFGVFGAAGVCLTYIIAYACWYVALSMVRPVRLAAIFNIEPVVTLVVAWLALGERLTPVQSVGALLVIGSVLGISLAKAAEERPS